jgi:MFS superfamily sulfate permease-like transporter
LSLALVVEQLSRPPVHEVVRDPVTAVWGRRDVNPGWAPEPGILVVVSGAPLWYANVVSVTDRVLALVAASDPPPERVVLDLVTSADLDVTAIDGIGQLADSGARGDRARSVGRRGAGPRGLDRAGVSDRLTIAPRLEVAVGPERPRAPSPGRP